MSDMFTDKARLDLIERTRTYPFWNVDKWSFRHDGHWYHAATVRAVLDAAAIGPGRPVPPHRSGGGYALPKPRSQP